VNTAAPVDAPTRFAALDAATAPAVADWVAAFDDPSLPALVEEALRDNPDVLAARAALEAAEARARAAGASRLPSLDGSFSAREQDGGFSSGSSFSLGLEASWQADVWGRLSDQARAGALSADASRADWYGARLSIAAAAARAWYALNEASLQTELARQDVATRQRQLDIVERRFNRGVARSSDVRTARSALASSEAGLASRIRSERAAARTLETLLGDYPAGAITAAGALPSLRDLPNPGSPEAVLERRPDIVAADARLAAAGFSADAARKALYPGLSLRAELSDSGANIEDVFDADELVSSVAASILAPIFRGGSLRAERDRAEAEARRLAASYVNTALNALREAENAIDADGRLAERVDALTRASDEAAEALALVERQYASGVATIFELIDAQSRLISAQGQLITARAQRVDNRIALHLAVADDFNAAGGIAAAEQ
jgi:NodT family efflux transporter outer membrane factor (OMF) lipoprotein